MAADLTDAKVRGFKATGARVEIKDGRYPLYCVVSPTGSKAWQWRGRIGTGHGRRTLGHYPAMSLSQARTAALAIKADKSAIVVPDAPVAAPEPVVVVPQAKTGMTVREAFAAYMRGEGDARKTADEKWRVYLRDVDPSIGEKLISEVTHDDLADIVAEKYEVAPISSNRLQALLSRFFRWCRTKGRRATGLERNPMADVVKLAEEVARTRWLNERELKWFFKALPVAQSFAPVFETMLYTVARRSDIFDLEWGQVESDGLNLPETKNTLPHVIYQVDRVRELIGDRPEEAKDGDPVFKVQKSGYSKPTDRLRAKMIELAAADGYELEHWRFHDLRTSATTILGSFRDADDRQLVTGETRSKLLAHKDTSVRGRHYDRYAAYAEKKAALILWGDYLDKLRKEK